MIAAFLALLLFQLAGEWLTHTLSLPIPGAVVGMALLLIALFAFPSLHGRLQALAHGLLRNLSIFFIPAGVGVMVMLADVKRYAPVLVLTITLGTWLTGSIAAWVFQKVGRSA